MCVMAIFKYRILIRLYIQIINNVRHNCLLSICRSDTSEGYRHEWQIILEYEVGENITMD